MFELFVGLSVGFGVLSGIFIFKFLDLSHLIKKAIYFPQENIVIILHSYHELGNIANAEVYINEKRVGSRSFIFIPRAIAFTICSAGEMKPENILIREDVPKSISFGPIIFKGKQIIKP